MLLRVVMALVAVLSIGLFAALGYAWATLRNIDNGISRVTLSGPTPPISSTVQDDTGTAQNIMLVGIDDRTNMTDAEVRTLKVGRDGGSMATDTMMIVHVPADGSGATIISLPRDSWVHIAGFGWNRLNAAYADGYLSAASTAPKITKVSAGVNLLRQTVQNVTGLRIDHYVQVSFLGFYEISKAIGGVPVNLCQNVNDTVAYNRAHGVQGGSGFHMSKGHHVLEGATALEFVRQRHNLSGPFTDDFGRELRQRYFLAAAFSKVASVGLIFKLNALGDALKRNLYMDQNLDLLGLARQLQDLSANNIVGKTIPTANATIAGNDVLRLNLPRVRNFIAKTINPPKATDAHRGVKHRYHHAGANCIY
jgi:LCP family protein required for cell wall assembly